MKIFRDGALTVAVENRVLRDGAEVARLAHNQEAEGSIPSPATKFRLDIITPCEGDPSDRSRLQTTQSKLNMETWPSGLWLWS